MSFLMHRTYYVIKPFVVGQITVAFRLIHIYRLFGYIKACPELHIPKKDEFVVKKKTVARIALPALH